MKVGAGKEERGNALGREEWQNNEARVKEERCGWGPGGGVKWGELLGGRDPYVCVPRCFPTLQY